MEYSIKEIVRIIGAQANNLQDSTISILLTDSRRLSFPEQSLFFALKTKTNDGHRYIKELYKLRVRNFVVSEMLPEFESLGEANFLVVKDTLKALQKLATHHRKQFNIPVIGIKGVPLSTIAQGIQHCPLATQLQFTVGRAAICLADKRQEYAGDL